MNSKSGITIVEILVTISVMAILSSILIIYNHSSERQLVLLKEQARLVSTLNRAKSLAMNLFREPPTAAIPCGYGVHFSIFSSSYVIFRDLPPAGGCEASDHQYSPGEDFGEMIYTDKVIKIDSASTTLSEIFFIPPDPQVILNGDSDITEDKEVVLKIEGASGNRKVIKVNKAGQITTD